MWDRSTWGSARTAYTRSTGICWSSSASGRGVVNPRTPETETVAAIVERVKEALQYLPPERIFLNPDCGFGTFSSRPMNSVKIAVRKLEALAQAAAVLRADYPETG